MIFSIPPLYPYSGFDFWSDKDSNLIFIDSARSGIYLIAKHFADHIFLIPSYTCPTVWSALDQAGVVYDFVDVDESLDFDALDLEPMLKKYENRNIALISTSLFSAKIKDYKSLFPNLIVIEDRAQGLQDVSFTADFWIFSFGKGKMISGFGGGAIYDKNSILKDTKTLPIKNDFFRSYLLSIAQKVISRFWWLVENSSLDPENSTKLEVDKIVPSKFDGLKKRWILNTIQKVDLSHRIKISNFYLENIDSKYLFSLQKDTPYLRMPIKKDIKFSGISKMRDYHETYHLACKKRRQELDGAKKLVDGCFLPTHDLVDLKYAKKVVELVNV